MLLMNKTLAGRHLFGRCLLTGLALLAAPVAPAGTVPDRLSIGRPATPDDIARWDIDVGPDGAGLPAGGATARDGEPVYLQKCAGCHGEDGRRGRDRLAAAPDDDRRKTIGNYWPYATTIFDYIRRAMPPDSPGSLSDQEVYALTARILYLNALVRADERIDAESLPRIAMPARDRFVPDNREGGPEVR